MERWILFCIYFFSYIKWNPQFNEINGFGKISNVDVGMTKNNLLEGYFDRTTAKHLDPVFQVNLSVKTEDEVSVFSCPFCFKICGGPKCLKRHKWL